MSKMKTTKNGRENLNTSAEFRQYGAAKNHWEDILDKLDLLESRIEVSKEAFEQIRIYADNEEVEMVCIRVLSELEEDSAGDAE